MELEVARTKSSLNSWLKAKRGIRLMTIEWKEMPKKNPGHGGRWVEGGAVAVSVDLQMSQKVLLHFRKLF